MKNILIINHYAGGDKYGMEFRPFYMGRELVKLGYNVTVLAASFSHLRRVQPDVSKDFEEEIIDGVRFVWVKTPSYKKNDHMRLFNVLNFYFKVKRKAKMLARKYSPDIVIGSSTYPQDMYLANKICRFSGAKSVFEVHDIWPMTLISIHGMSESNPLIKMIQKGEHYAISQSDGIISILEHVNLHIQELGYTDFKFFPLPNGVYIGNNRPAPQEYTDLIKQLKQDGNFIVMYLGGFAVANALEELIDSAAFLPDNVKIVMVGDGFLKKQYQKTAEEKGYKNVIFLPFIEKPQINDMLSQADCLYIGAKKQDIYRYGVGMNKLCDYMLAKKPIIYGVETTDSPVKKAGCGIEIAAESSSAIAGAVVQLMHMSEQQRLQMGENAYAYVLENHEYSMLAKKFADALLEIEKG